MGRWIPEYYQIHCPQINENVTMIIESKHIIGTSSYMLKDVLDSSCGIYETCPAKDEKGRCLGFLKVEKKMRKAYEDSF